CYTSATACVDDSDCPSGSHCSQDACVPDAGDDTPTPLSPPRNLVAIALDDRSVFLAWTNTEPAATGFLIERALDGDEPPPIFPSGTVSPAGTTDDSPGLQEGVTFVYQVRAQGDGVPDSDPSDPPSSATVLPNTPATFTATAAGITRIILS